MGRKAARSVISLQLEAFNAYQPELQHRVCQTRWDSTDTFANLPLIFRISYETGVPTWNFKASVREEEGRGLVSHPGN